jgi:hypothetical protein
VAWLKTIFQELFGLFVEDGNFALAILAWLAILWLVLPRLPVLGAWQAIILFVGLIAILIESVLRRSAQR